MSKKVSRSLSFFIVFALVLTNLFCFSVSDIASAVGTTYVETFDNFNEPGTTYANGSFVGNNNITWNYISARKDEGFVIDGKGMMLRNSGSKCTSELIPGGISSFSVELKKGFTGSGNRQIELFINEESKGLSQVFDDTDVHSFTVDNINIDGDIVIEIRNVTAKQVVIDNITWTSYDDGGSGTDPDEQVANVTALPAPGAVEEGTEVTLSTSTEGATVYYAVYTDEITDADYEIFYDNNPIVVNEPLTIKAFAAKEGLEDSDVTEFEYTIKEPALIKSIAEARGFDLDTEVTVEGIATADLGSNNYIQDDTAGIIVRLQGLDMIPGNRYRITAKLKDYYGMAQLEPSTVADVVLVKEGVGVPAPQLVTSSDLSADLGEDYEGELVKIENVTAVEVDAYRNFKIEDKEGISAARPSDASWMEVDKEYSSIIGVVTYDFGEYKIYPRTLEDISENANSATDLFISEYIEGGSNNKAIEIYNGTRNTVDLSTYKVELYSNGSTSATNTENLSGTLAHDEVFIIANSGSVQEILNKSDITSTVTYFNGDDAIVLKHNDEIIDVFGQVGVDPGSAWGTGDNTTVNHTLVRKSSITVGDVNPDDEFDPVTEWDIYLQDTFDYLGSHTMGDGHQDPDTTLPTINHTPVTDGNVNEDLTIITTVTDDRQVESVKLHYRTEGAEDHIIVDMTKMEDSYTYTISKTNLTVAGIEYYIEASDGTNTATSPEDVSIPYQIVISEEDIAPPQVINLTPASGSSTGTELKPVISAEYSDVSGIDTASIKLYLDGTEVTGNTTITEAKINYTPSTDLVEGNHTVKLEVSDKAATPQTAIVEWNFYVGEKEYNLYFGQLHSHTNISDGQGSLDAAYSWARDKGNADFFAVTDHSNWFDNEKDTSNETITDVSQSTSEEWKLMHSIADSYNEDGEFVAIAGFEMTWSGSTGGWGHINTFNTPWFASRSNSNMDLPAYYSHISADTDSISQLNHPGKTFGDFADFGYYSEAVDNVVHLVEVGNGEGPIRGSGYFPSYEYYTRALDKGWHVAPSNNQDNHKGNWITSNEARTVVLASSLTRENIFDAIRKLSVYSTEDSNLEIMYMVNNEIMGSSLDDPDILDISIEVNDPDESDIIRKISIISNGGVVVQSKTFTDNTAVWNLQIDPKYNYYYVRVDQEDKDIAVTAPVWTSEVEAIGISKISISQDPVIVDEKVELSAEVYNNGKDSMTGITVEFYENEIKEANKIGETTISEIQPGKTGIANVDWTPAISETYTIYAKAIINLGGTDKIFTQSRKVLAGNEEDFVKILVDGGHSNQYVTGNYAGKIEALKEMMKERNYILNINMNELTSENLKGVSLLIITDPQGTDNPKYNEVKSNYTAEEIAVIKEFVENGGSIIVTSRADYKDGIEEYSNSAQLTPILEAIGTNLRVNDDEVIDKTTNGGQEYRLYFDQYVSSKYDLTKDIPEGTTYSFYSGCSVILKDGGNDDNVDWLVKGHETTETLDSDNVGDNISVEKGKVYVLAAEELTNGARVIVAGTTFFSDFETASSDNQYSNKQITENIFDWIIQPEEAELKTIAEVRADEDNDGKPDLYGQKFTIEGRVTAQSEAVTPKNAFFEVIYVQDETGGITVFGVSATPLPLGTRVRVTGIVDQYDGDAELSVENESKDIVVLGDEIVLVEPKIMTTGDSMLEENEGWLVKVQGRVSKMTENSLYIDDGTGEARVYVNGYIGDGTGNSDTLGKWDPAIKVGDRVSAIGLASEDPEGHRIRVRNTAEIVKIEEIGYPVSIQAVKTSDVDGNLCGEFIEGNVVMVNTVITNSSQEDITGTVIIKLVDSEDRTYAIGFMNGVELGVEGLKALSMGFKVNGVSKGAHTAKVYMWNDFIDKAPLSEVGTVEFIVK
ncbi:CehA/McbA family metallohydrolase [Brassicibacter mesophilus]|uniref:CehA/McbA family metallohydrolase n=1 Tax=Brassicibacter mesophilus TaxID=745119 RepID=UPI003D1BCFD3